MLYCSERPHKTHFGLVLNASSSVKRFGNHSLFSPVKAVRTIVGRNALVH
jgi:hypothetical protein